MTTHTDIFRAGHQKRSHSKNIWRTTELIVFEKEGKESMDHCSSRVSTSSLGSFNFQRTSTNLQNMLQTNQFDPPLETIFEKKPDTHTSNAQLSLSNSVDAVFKLPAVQKQPAISTEIKAEKFLAFVANLFLPSIASLGGVKIATLKKVSASTVQLPSAPTTLPWVTKC